MAIKTPRSIWTNPIHFLAFGFGSGAMPKMPGTWGTVVAIPFYLLMQDLSLIAYCSILLVAILIAIYLCDRTSKDLKVHDHPGIVIDEIVGYLLTMILAPKGWLWIFLGFIYFRIFDIVKPWPIRWIDKQMPGGLGIVMDDLIAGIFAWILLQASAWFFLPLLD